MTDISDDQVDELLRKAEQRLKNGPVSASAIVSSTTSNAVVAGDAATTKQLVKQQNSSSNSSSKKDGLTVRAPPQPQLGLKAKEKSTAGPEWFDLPKTNMTPEFKREWQVLRMRGILDPKHQKKNLRASAPEYSQVGEIIAGPTEFFSARLTRKERKNTLLEEVTRDLDSHKFTDKYAGIQKQKTSGKKAFYKNVLILSLYQPNPPEVIAQTQATLSRLQGTPEAWGLARILLEKPDQQVKFFGALTIVIKLNNESSSLSPEDASELLLLLINHYLDTLRSRSSPLVARKLASALATFYINFHQLWSRFIRHLIFCLVSGQSCLPSALDEGQGPDTVSLMERMEPSQAQAALWVLTNVFDEVAKINLNSVQNIGIYGSILENSSDAVALMSRSMSPQTTTEEAHEDAIRCLQSWVWFAQKSSSKDTRLSEPIGPLITAVITSLTVDELYSVSVELMVDLLSNCLMFLSDTHFDNLAHLFDSPWSQRRYEKLVQGDFEFDSLQYGLLFLAFGEAKIERFMQSGDSRSEKLLSNLCGLLAARGYVVEEDRIFVPALEFWLTYAETLTDLTYSDEESAGTWVPRARSHLLQAVSNAWQKIIYPPAEEFHSWDSSERISFHDARKDVVDLLQSVFTLVGPQLVSTFADLILKALSESSWPQLEAAAFCLGGLADCISETNRGDDALSVVFKSSLFAILRSGQSEIPPKVQQTCVSLIARYTEYFERNVSELHPVLNFIFGVVGEHAMANAAAKSIHRLCGSCRGYLHTEANSFLNEYQSLVSGRRLDCGASEKVVGGIASVIQAMPDSNQRYSACGRLLEFVQTDVQHSLDLLRSYDGSPMPCCAVYACSYAAPDESPALHTALKSLRCLASIGKGLQAPAELSVDLESIRPSTRVIDPHLAQLQGSIMSMISQIQEAFNTSGEVVELICSVLRSGFSESEPGPFVLPPQSVAQYLTNQNLETPRVGLLVKTACSFVSSLEHDGLDNQQDMLNSVLLWVIGLLKQLPNYEVDTELTQNGIDFVTRLLNKRPITLLRLQPSDAAEFFFLFTLQVLDGKEPLPKASAAEFWATFVSIKYESQELNDVAQQAMQMLGPLLSRTLARNLGGNASRSELDKLSEPLKKLVYRYPMAKTWLEAGLTHETFPSTKVTPQEKSMFLKKIISLRGAKATNQVVRDFWQSARGSNFAYAS
ncbi:member of the karyopherin-beta family nuclear import [Fusarium tjaetaba]|uniref:Member of the karyopherin-beta family nuclear import n=1 Tax=Fusarium tjaetaba TaxID=1567544 RepID=A0A8H5S2W7_9HYPO|nr:member of the karyopherin-beta family nuclear import [Fusarium tjaetaba]KAF5642906.1 member of the karyopherin-beta family nuclear import [Fusarium tjaetaba]